MSNGSFEQIPLYPRHSQQEETGTSGGQRLESMTDEQLVTLTQQGNLQAFNSLTSRWQTSIYRFVLRVLGNQEDARDVCQEALLKAYLNIERLRDGRKFKSWLHHIALNLCRDRFRSATAKADVRSYEEEGLDEKRVAAERAEERSPETDATKVGLFRILGEVFHQIPVEQRSALLLREYHGFTSEEIGEITGVPAATVRTRIFYGLRSIRKQLDRRGIT
jgi:RNA polymerase sigma-70 factor (ECF subfamily)